MDTQAIAEQVAGAVQNAPELLQGLGADPAAAIEQITGNSLEGLDLAGVLESVGPLLENTGIDLGAIGGEGGLSGLIEGITGEGSPLSGLVGEGSPLGGIAEGIMGGGAADSVRGAVEGVLGGEGESPLNNISGFLSNLFGK